jgi:hypothetical protein
LPLHGIDWQQPSVQRSVPPHPSALGPQSVAEQVVGVQLVVVVVLDVVVVVGHGPLSSVPPQSSESIPQSWAPHVVGVQQALWKHTCPPVQAETQVWPAPQVRHVLASQVPQLSVPPQLSITPQVAPALVQVVGVQPVPNSGFARPGGVTGLSHFPPQQLTCGVHCFPSGLQPLERASRAVLEMRATTATSPRAGVARIRRRRGCCRM